MSQQHTLDLPVITIMETGTRHVLPTDKELQIERDSAEGNIKDIGRRIAELEERMSKSNDDNKEEASKLSEERASLERQMDLAQSIRDRLDVAISNRSTIIAEAEIVSIGVRVPTYDELSKAEGMYRTLEGERFVTDRAKVVQHLMRTCAPDVAKHHPVIGRHVERWLMRAVWPEDELLPFWYIALNRS
jgi:hypothetical protein